MGMRRIPFSRVEIAGAIIIGVLFLVSAYLTDIYRDDIFMFIGSCEYFGVIAYIGSAILATVLAPVSATPLIPIASQLWGPVLSAIYSIIGWMIGAMIAFWIARRYGYERVRRLVKIQKLQRYLSYIPEKNLFWTVVFMRIVLPVDILSYALGLFSTMSLWSYALATLVGITPFAFIFAYTAHLPLWLQAIALLCIGVALFISYQKMRTSFIEQTRDSE